MFTNFDFLDKAFVPVAGFWVAAAVASILTVSGIEYVGRMLQCQTK